KGDICSRRTLSQCLLCRGHGLSLLTRTNRSLWGLKTRAVPAGVAALRYSHSSSIPKNEHLRNLFVKRLDFYSINSFIWNMKNSALDNFNLLLYFCMNWASYIYMTFWRVQINET